MLSTKNVQKTVRYATIAVLANVLNVNSTFIVAGVFDMSRGGTSFGDHKTYRLRKYYGAWIKRTLLTASNTVSNPCDRLRILHFMENLKAPAIEDPGRIPCGDLQKIGRASRFPDKIACLLVMIRHLVISWWKTNEKTPGYVESLLVELDIMIENWGSTSIIGSSREGYHLEVAWL